MIKYYNPTTPDILIDMDGDKETIFRKFGLISIDVEDPNINERKKYENKYLQATKQLMVLANEPITVEWPKLEDTDFERIGITAATNNPGLAGFLLITLEYTLRTLKYDFQWQWEDIEYRPEIV